MSICVVGTGYVGLVTGTCFAEMGNHVICVDQNEDKIATLNAGRMPIYEPGLKELIAENVKARRLVFSTDIAEGIQDADFCFIAVGTPPGEDGAADISQVLNVAGRIGEHMSGDIVVVNKSTVPVGTADKVKAVIRDALKKRGREDLRFDIVANPEFLKEGAAIEDFMRPDRIIIGTDSIRIAEVMKQLYEPFVKNRHPILIMDIKSAEIAKYAANAMLATRISFMNEIALLCDKVGADIANVRLGIGTDSRIGMPFLYAGVGYGGSCFPKDVKELIRTGEKNCFDMRIIKAVEMVNNQQKEYLVELIKKRFGENLADKKMGVWGLAFKPQTDDMREAPSLVVIEALMRMGAHIVAYDPEAITQAKAMFTESADKLAFAETMMEAVDNVDALLLITEWRQFRQPDFTEMKNRMRQAVIFDGRNQYSPDKMARLGFEYYCVGRGCNGN